MLAWGELGHRTIASIAYAQSSWSTRRAIRKLLRQAEAVDTPTCPLRTLEDAAQWPDCIKGLGPRFAYASAWHYQDISVCADFDITGGCPDGVCVTTQIPKQQAILADTTRPVAERIMALAFLVHLVGDMHQPLHIGEKADHGGNYVPVDYRLKPGSNLNLHRIWDTEIAERELAEAPAIGARSVTRDERKQWRQGDVTSWAHESWLVAKDVVYPGLKDFPDECTVPVAAPPPSGTPDPRPRAVVDEAYVAAAVPVVRAAVEAAGVRAAMLLDMAFARPKR